MPALRLEHVNITVVDLDPPARRIESIFCWRVRWRGPARDGGETIHVGTDDHYIALYRPPRSSLANSPIHGGQPLNHIGVEVDDLDATEARVVSHGLTPFSHDDYEPGRRFYFRDPEGIEFEVVSYARQ
jgi:catechol 2,3-dioxygenase-like lactoylglutathione lyase family enzyme